MRELKFRVWDIGMGEMFQNATTLNVDTGTYMQYTGRKDKNGQEIYEGDIVKRFGERPWVMSDGSKKYSTWSVEFKYGQWQLRNTPISPALSYTHFDSIARDLIIIGNIYEHTHLLEEKE